MKKVMAFLLVVFLAFTSSSFIVAPATAEENLRLPVAELFVSVGCYYCSYAEDALPGLMASTGALVLEYHLWSDQAGWALQEGDALASSYSIHSTPALMVDGVVKLDGADPSGYKDSSRFLESCRDAYIAGVNSRPIFTNVRLSVTLTRTGSDFFASATVTQGSALQANLAIRMVVFETTAVHDGKTYYNVVRAMLQPDLASGGNSSTFTKSFSSPAATGDAANLRIAGIVYDADTGEIYQSAYSGPYPGSQTPIISESADFSTMNIVLVGAAVVLAVAVLVRWKRK